MQKRLSVSGAKEGINFTFDNCQILNYQDNFKYLADLPFAVYFDFKTTTGGNCNFFGARMFAVSYCQIYSFHPSLKLNKIVIYRSFEQTPEQIYDLGHISDEHVAFFDRRTFN